MQAGENCSVPDYAVPSICYKMIIENARCYAIKARITMKIIVGLVITALLSGCASSAHDRRMAEADGESETARNIKIGLAALAVGAVAYYAVKGNAGGAGYSPPHDYEWDWDQFYNQGSLVWACRGVQTGQFAEQSRCQHKYQVDYRWPGK